MPQLITPTKFGRYGVHEPFRGALQHLYRGAPLKPQEWEIPLPVLNQEDLFSQHIDTSRLIAGAPRVDALGSCTANATAASLAERYDQDGRHASEIIIRPRQDGPGKPVLIMSETDAAACEEWAIAFYDLTTHQDGDPAQEWPPADCGSSGLFCCRELITLGLIKGYQTGTGARTVASMLQSGSVIMGSPWFTSWMDPGADGFVDGDGSMAAFDTAVSSGVAGGHETCIYALPRITQTPAGDIDLEQSWVQARNSWSHAWGLSGDYRIHLSTLEWLAQSTDYKQFQL